MGLLDFCAERWVKFGDRYKSEKFLADPAVADLSHQLGDEIARVLSETEYFHGTGRLHYAPNGASKYAGTTGDVKDVLPSLVQDGLSPYEDLFSVDFTGADQPTISLSNARMYARVYADLFQSEGESYQYEYGSRKFWWDYFLLKMVLEAITDGSEYEEHWHQILNKNSAETIQKKEWKRGKLQHWTSTFRNDDQYVTEPMELMRKAKSTIPHNTPLIIGIGRDAFSEVPIKRRAVRMYEVRSGEAIPVEKWTYVEVPLAKVEDTRADLRDLGFDLPVLPTELVELHMSTKPMKELAAPHPAYASGAQRLLKAG